MRSAGVFALILLVPLISFAADVRVRLNIQVKNFEIGGVAVSYQGQKANYLSVAVPRAQTLKISRKLFQQTWVWQIVSANRTEIRTEEVLAIRGTALEAEGKALPPHLFLQAKKSGFDVIGVLPLEDYLVGVLASEMPLRWPLESLKAQAVAARSYTQSLMRERKSQSFHIESNIQDQVFRHVAQGVDRDPLIAKAVEAVNSTRGLILISPKSKQVMKAFYHSDCGGKTSPSKLVWGYGTANASVVDSSCPTRPESHWRFRITEDLLKQKLAKILNQDTEKFLPQTLASLEFHRADPNSRVDQINVKLADGSKKAILADQFRAELGYSNLKSTNFEFSEDSGSFVFKGRGFGHGVGLCQWGSRALATRGQNYTQILKHYYPEALLTSAF